MKSKSQGEAIVLAQLHATYVMEELTKASVLYGTDRAYHLAKARDNKEQLEEFFADISHAPVAENAAESWRPYVLD